MHKKTETKAQTHENSITDVPQDEILEGQMPEDLVEDAPEECSNHKEESKEPDWKDAYVRLAADFDNYRKRSNQEFDDAKRRERERVMNAWLDVYDATERAIAALPEKEGPWYEGFMTLIKQMNQTLASFKIKPMQSLGTSFDPKYHEAIATLPQPSAPNNSIIHVEKCGFVYENGDVMRVASVVVAKNT